MFWDFFSSQISIPVSPSKIQYSSSYTPQCRGLTQILHQNGFIVFFLQSRHAVVHHQLGLLRQVHSHFWLDSTKQEGLQDPLQLSSWKEKHSMRDTVCQCWFNEQLSGFFTHIKYIPNHVTNIFKHFIFQDLPLMAMHVEINITGIWWSCYMILETQKIRPSYQEQVDFVHWSTSWRSRPSHQL